MSWNGGSDVRDVAIICGPTAAGKSAIAMALAAQSGAVIVSADSRQIYRSFDIGTAKPSAHDRSVVTHEGIDVVEPIHRYSAAQWVEHASLWLANADAKGSPVVIVGGTGFYLRALETPLFESPPLAQDSRAAVLAELDLMSTDQLREQCLATDPGRAHLGRTQLLRALEVFRLTGRPLSTWLHENQRTSTVRGHYLLVDPGAELQRRITSRVHQMLDIGWEAEIETLARSVPDSAPAWNACGYSLLRQALTGTMSRDAAIERTIIDTRQYAKRQRTWFRHQLPPERVTTLDPTRVDAQQRAIDWWRTLAPSETQ